MLDELRKKNSLLIEKYENNLEELNRQLIISELLKNDKCFYIIPIELAYNLLQDLEYPAEMIPKIYESLI